MFVSPIEKPYYCGVLYVAILTSDPAATTVESLHVKQKIVGLNPCLPKHFFLFFPGPLTGLDYN